jgi:E3 ubiquitin-protein ligase HECTD3
VGFLVAAYYDDLEEKDTRVKYMWEALKNFSNEDRSRFLRFITGRRRLPASVYISTGRG